MISVGPEICDFCCGKPEWEFRAKSFSIPIGTKTMVCDEWWLACEPCAQCILNNDWDKLAKRSVMNISPLDVLTGVEHFKEFHKMFRENQTGEVITYRGAPK
jgi:hypothetical protein